MQKGNIIKEICLKLLENKKQEGVEIAREKYPFRSYTTEKRKYNAYQQTQVFLRDGFIDRYSGEKLLFPGVFRILKTELPEVFPYHQNWKMTDTHIVYWELFPTIDHVFPIARGGQDVESNWVTTSMLRNSVKSNWTLEDIGWSLKQPGDLKEWDGLTGNFLDLVNAKPELLEDNYIKRWYGALRKAI